MKENAEIRCMTVTMFALAAWMREIGVQMSILSKSPPKMCMIQCVVNAVQGIFFMLSQPSKRMHTSKVKLASNEDRKGKSYILTLS